LQLTLRFVTRTKSLNLVSYSGVVKTIIIPAIFRHDLSTLNARFVFMIAGPGQSQALVIPLDGSASLWFKTTNLGFVAGFGFTVPVKKILGEFKLTGGVRLMSSVFSPSYMVEMRSSSCAVLLGLLTDLDDFSLGKVFRKIL
jgi:hypothetical protein